MCLPATDRCAQDRSPSDVIGPAKLDDAAAAIEKAQAEAIVKNGCFTGDTEVYVEGGGVEEIQYISVGQKVLSRCEITGEIGYRKVIKKFEHDEVPCYYVRYFAYRDYFPQGSKSPSPKGLVTATAEHPFWVKGKGWTAVIDLQPGDELMSCDDTLVILDSVTRAPFETIVYNLHVEDFHTYFAGVDAIWVHNTECMPEVV